MADIKNAVEQPIFGAGSLDPLTTGRDASFQARDRLAPAVLRARSAWSRCVGSNLEVREEGRLESVLTYRVRYQPRWLLRHLRSRARKVIKCERTTECTDSAFRTSWRSRKISAYCASRLVSARRLVDVFEFALFIGYARFSGATAL
jgi:hypothetical protein